MGEIIQLSVEPKEHETVFYIHNLKNLNSLTIEKLKNFAYNRQGFFSPGVAQMSVRKKWSQDIARQVLELLGFTVEFTFPVSQYTENLLCQQRVSFGFHQGKKWEEVPTNYLQWVLTTEENYNWYMAHTELKRRNSSTQIDIEKRINYGKYKGTIWKDLPNEYLVWLVNNFEEDHPDYVFAKAAILYQKAE
jgi:uncharacterized protein (DUF3820 family)